MTEYKTFSVSSRFMQSLRWFCFEVMLCEEAELPRLQSKDPRNSGVSTSGDELQNSHLSRKSLATTVE